MSPLILKAAIGINHKIVFLETYPRIEEYACVSINDLELIESDTEMDIAPGVYKLELIWEGEGEDSVLVVNDYTAIVTFDPTCTVKGSAK